MFFYVQGRGALLLTTTIEVASDSRGDNFKLVGPQRSRAKPKRERYARVALDLPDGLFHKEA
ncbi:hypothetical protein N7455_005312 [Penicillium solitum]|uniref:uncharacterized protein n=1 Tax=Penicillium solitum TaxID=60172 RepID=UPI0017D1B7BD|nr:hypothetical protein HAV15_010923 [Penicillium sp. str. \